MELILNPISVVRRFSNGAPNEELAITSETMTHEINIKPPIDSDCKNSLKGFKLMRSAMLVKIEKMA